MFESMLDGMMGLVEGARFMPEVPIVRDVRTTWEGTIWVLRRGPDPVGEALALSGTGESEPGPIRREETHGGRSLKGSARRWARE